MWSLHYCRCEAFTNKSANSSEHVEVAALRNSNSSINGHWLGRFSRLNDSFIGKKALCRLLIKFCP